MIDVHSHVLPKIDDGSISLEMTEKMLEVSAKMNITTQIATPHFYADRMRLESFLEKRENAFLTAASIAEQKGIRLLKGAEVAFFRGIGRSESIQQLTIGDTDLMLIEMPFRAWNDIDLEDVSALIERGIIPIIAHIERFYGFQKDKKIIERLMDMPLYVQINAGSLTHWSTRGKLLKLFKEERAHFLGSDCHNLTSRPQNLAQGRAVIEKKLGKEILTRIDMNGKNLFE